MQRRNFLRTLIGAVVAGPTVMRGIAAAAPVVPVAEPVVVATGTATILDIRAILTQNMLRDIQAEEDRLFIERVNSIAKQYHEPS